MHADQELLSLLALGESGAADAEQLDHIARCPECTAEIAELKALVTEVRSVTAPYALEEPSPQVWERIRQQLDLVPDSGTPLLGSTAAEPDPDGMTTSLDRQLGRREGPRRSWMLALAAAIALIVGIGGTLAAQRWLAPSETVVSSTRLAALPDWAGSTGYAELEVDSDGRRWLVVSVDPSRPVDGLQQVWLINKDVSAMLQVGLLSYSGQRFQLPAEVDVDRYPVVDVSDEPPTGDGAHSGDSIVRGVLPL